MLVARYGGTPELAARVEEAVRSQQNNDVAVAIGQAGAVILEQVVVHGSSVAEAVAWALQPGHLASEDVRLQLAERLSDTTPSLNGVWGQLRSGTMAVLCCAVPCCAVLVRSRELACQLLPVWPGCACVAPTSWLHAQYLEPPASASA